ncbi:UDP-glycosyltransferase 74F2-like [Momordica charantia]|uniref:Glycosyltransferase n=1 Tax=Momordica charantia TaxID=3673 RepID=A0A6J1DX00_MOMCH|nr:UDP-glycosyltransferase 74F2-like [Momordica charantia]
MADGGDSNGRRLHILVVTYPAQGHINPLLQFSKRLHHKGAAVTFVLSKFLFNNNTAAAAHPPPFPVETISDGHDHGGFLSADSIETYHELFEQAGSRTLRDLIRRLAAAGRRVHAIAYDGFIPWVLDVAKEFGLKTALYFTQSCAVNNIYYHVYRGEIKVPPPAGEEIRIAGMPPLTVADMPSFVQDRNPYPGFFDVVINQFRNIEEADWVVCNSFYELEQQVLEWMGKKWAMKMIGPNIPSMYTDRRIDGDGEYGFSLFNPKGEVCRKWLDGRRKASVVFVSFGSFAALSVEEMEELAWGLKQTNYYFLWVVRAKEEEKLPTKFAEETAEKGLLVSWCPQLEILSHESIGCFVTHCGWNSTLEALTIGVPMVAMPQWTDQTTNAKCIMDIWKTGIRAPADNSGIVRRAAVAECIGEIMEGDGGKEIRRNAAKWGALARQAVGRGGSSDMNVDQILADLASAFN